MNLIDVEIIKNDIYWEMRQESKSLILGGWQIKGSKYFYTNLMMFVIEDEPDGYEYQGISVGGRFSFIDSSGNFGDFGDCEWAYDGDTSEMMEAFKKAKNWEEILSIEKFATQAKLIEEGKNLPEFIFTGFWK